MSTEAELLPIGKSDFRSLRLDDSVYVDKTDKIADIARLKRTFCLSRPHRFGKTLLLSTFASLFSNGIEDFKGLKIEKLWKDDKTYTVINLDLSKVADFESIDEFRKSFERLITGSFADAGIELKTTEAIRFRDRFSSTMKDCGDRSLVLLVDEYDSPLNRCMHRSELFGRVRKVMDEFYSTIKSFGVNSKFRFIFLTGINQYSETEFFYGLNNMIDLTQESEYGDLLGFSMEEIEQYFPDFLSLAQEKLSLTHGELMEKIEENCGGFSFDERGRCRVCEPLSVLMFLKSAAAE